MGIPMVLKNHVRDAYNSGGFKIKEYSIKYPR